MLHTIKGIRAFDTSAAFTGNTKSLARFGMSIFLLNLLPFIQFSVILLYSLQYLEVNILSILIIFALSISIFGFDKIFQSMLVRSRHRLYSEAELKAILVSSEHIKRKFDSHYFQLLVPGLLYIFIPLGFLVLEFDLVAGLIIIFFTSAASLSGWYHWRNAATAPKINDKPWRVITAVRAQSRRSVAASVSSLGIEY